MEKDADTRQTMVLLAAIEAMEATLAVAEALVAERRRIDLDGLDSEVGRICAACLAAPSGAAAAVRARLIGLLRVLDRLRGVLAEA